MKHELTIDKIPLRNYGVWFDGGSVFNGGSPDKTQVTIPGRNGDILLLNDRFSNVDIPYKAMIHRGFAHRFEELRAFLFSDLGYRRIEDSHIPNKYRLGHISKEINPTDIYWNSDVGMFTITFNCKPQLFLEDGETAQTVTGSGTIHNPTRFNALPLITVNGRSGTLRINDTVFTISLPSGVNLVYLDCDAQEAYRGDENYNKYIRVSGDSFPVLVPGENTIIMTGGISSVEIKPRWWTL